MGLAYNLTMEILKHCDMRKETAEFVASIGNSYTRTLDLDPH
jgi:hypothetical protein